MIATATATTLPLALAAAGERPSVPAHLGRVTLLVLWIRCKRNISEVARRVNRSTTTVRRKLVEFFGYQAKPAVRRACGPANPMWGKSHSDQTRAEISRKVRESNRFIADVSPLKLHA